VRCALVGGGAPAWVAASWVGCGGIPRVSFPVVEGGGDGGGLWGIGRGRVDFSDGVEGEGLRAEARAGRAVAGVAAGWRG